MNPYHYAAPTGAHLQQLSPLLSAWQQQTQDPRQRQVIKTEPLDEAEAEMRARAERVILEEQQCCHLFLDGGTTTRTRPHTTRPMTHYSRHPHCRAVDQRDVEGMEHHVSRPTLRVLRILTEELEQNPQLLARLKRKFSEAVD